MKFTPQSTEGWERFWLILIGTVVLALSLFFAQFGRAYILPRSYREWLEVILLLSTVELGIYSAALLRRGRIVLALLGFAMFAVGAWQSLPTLAAR